MNKLIFYISVMILAGCQSNEIIATNSYEMKLIVLSEVNIELGGLSGIGGYARQYVDIEIIEPEVMKKKSYKLILKEGFVTEVKDWIPVGSEWFPIGSVIMFTVRETSISDDAIRLDKNMKVIKID